MKKKIENKNMDENKEIQDLYEVSEINKCKIMGENKELSKSIKSKIKILAEKHKPKKKLAK